MQFDADVHAMILLFGKEGERVCVVGHVERAALRHVYAALVRVLTYAHRRVQPVTPARIRGRSHMPIGVYSQSVLHALGAAHICPSACTVSQTCIRDRSNFHLMFGVSAK